MLKGGALKICDVCLEWRTEARDGVWLVKPVDPLDAVAVCSDLVLAAKKRDVKYTKCGHSASKDGVPRRARCLFAAELCKQGLEVRSRVQPRVDKRETKRRRHSLS